MPQPNKVTTGSKMLDSLLDGGFPKGSAILVDGNPGTGKTVFCTQFLYHGAKVQRERGVFVTFFEDHVDFKRNAKLLGFDFESLERRKLIKFLSSTPMTTKGMRDSIGNIVQSVLAFKPRRVVFDSLSSMIQAMGPDETRTFLHTIFGKFVKEKRITTLLVGEIPYGQNSTIDGIEEFFVDGIIRLGRSPEHLRNLEMQKMRGVRLYESTRFFTLDDGFQIIAPPISQPIPKPEVWKPMKDAESCFSSGSRTLDALLGGGYPKGGYIVLEADPNVPIEVIRLFQFPVAWNFLAQQRSVLFMPTLGASSGEIRQLMTWHISVETFDKLVRIFERTGTVPWLGSGDQPSYVVSCKANDPVQKTEQLLNQTCLDLMQHSGKPVLRIIGYPTLENIYHGHQDMLYGAIGDAIAQNILLGNLTLATTRSDSEVTHRILDLVNWHFKLIERNGCVFMRVVKPRPTPYLSVSSEVREGIPRLRLTPMV